MQRALITTLVTLALAAPASASVAAYRMPAPPALTVSYDTSACPGQRSCSLADTIYLAHGDQLWYLNRAHETGHVLDRESISPDERAALANVIGLNVAHWADPTPAEPVAGKEAFADVYSMCAVGATWLKRFAVPNSQVDYQHGVWTTMYGYRITQPRLLAACRLIRASA